MPTSIDALRRWLGMFCLAVAAGMLVWGHTILASHLKGTGFLIYWTACFLFTIASIVIALLDVRAMLRHLRKERAELLQGALKNLEQSAAARSGREHGEIPVARRSSESFEEVR